MLKDTRTRGLQKGISLPTPLPVSQNLVPPPTEPLASLNSGVEHSKYQYDLPANTAAQSMVWNIAILPKVLQLPSAEIKTSTIGAAPIISINLPVSTLSYHKGKEEQAKTLAVPRKRYKAWVGPSQCSKYHGERTPATGHKQYFGDWLYLKTSTESDKEKEGRTHWQKL